MNHSIMNFTTSLKFSNHPIMAWYKFQNFAREENTSLFILTWHCYYPLLNTKISIQIIYLVSMQRFIEEKGIPYTLRTRWGAPKWGLLALLPTPLSLEGVRTQWSPSPSSSKMSWAPPRWALTSSPSLSNISTMVVTRVREKR
jgi:hypothetical protein